VRKTTTQLDIDLVRIDPCSGFAHYTFGLRSSESRSTGTLSALHALQEFAERKVEGSRESCQMAQSDFTCASLQVRNVNFMDSALFSEVDLPPATLLSQFSNSLAKLDANIRGHSSSIDLAEALYLADALSREFGGKANFPHRFQVLGARSPSLAHDITAVRRRSDPAKSDEFQPGHRLRRLVEIRLREWDNDDSMQRTERQNRAPRHHL
jgi:hypothetical protein